MILHSIKICNICNVCIFLCGFIVSDLIKIRSNSMRIHRFGKNLICNCNHFRSDGIMTTSFFETRQWIWYLTIVIPTYTSLWMVPRVMRLKKLQLVIDEQSPMQIKPDSLTHLVKRKLRAHYVFRNHPQTLRGWHTARHTFHSEIGARSVLRVADEVLRSDELC